MYHPMVKISMNNELETDVERRGRGLYKILFQHLEERNDKKPQSREPMSSMRFEPSTS
jgi:hypothetical protein